MLLCLKMTIVFWFIACCKITAFASEFLVHYIIKGKKIFILFSWKCPFLVLFGPFLVLFDLFGPFLFLVIETEHHKPSHSLINKKDKSLPCPFLYSIFLDYFKTFLEGGGRMKKKVWKKNRKKKVFSLKIFVGDSFLHPSFLPFFGPFLWAIIVPLPCTMRYFLCIFGTSHLFQ